MAIRQAALRTTGRRHPAHQRAARSVLRGHTSILARVGHTSRARRRARPQARCRAPRPSREPAVRLVRADRAFVEADLEEEAERLADHRAGRHTEERHHLVAVEIGTDLLQLLLLAQHGDALLQLVHATAERFGLAGVAGGAVAAGQLVQLVEQMPGVVHVPSHRAVGPAHAVRVEAQVQVHEPGHVIDDLVRIPQREQPFLRHPRADHLVVVEPHAVVAEPARLRLADVVQSAASRTIRSGRVFATTAIVCASTSLCRWIGSCSSCMAFSSGRNSSESSVRDTSQSPATGRRRAAASRARRGCVRH